MRCRVAPFTGAWIETQRASLWKNCSGVAPFTGAWIETGPTNQCSQGLVVAPFTGAWIETTEWLAAFDKAVKSHPSRVRGLKHELGCIQILFCPVAPFTGAWIETLRKQMRTQKQESRTLHGCVD